MTVSRETFVLEDFIWGSEPFWRPAPSTDKGLCRCRPSQRKCPASRKIGYSLTATRTYERKKQKKLMQTAVDPNLLDRVWLAFGGTCQYCSMSAQRHSEIIRWTVDRLDSSGDYHPTNITLACWPCNGKKGTKKLLRQVKTLADVETENAPQ